MLPQFFRPSGMAYLGMRKVIFEILDREYPLLNEKDVVSDQDDKQYALVGIAS